MYDKIAGKKYLKDCAVLDERHDMDTTIEER